MSLSPGTESFPAIATRRTFANLSSPWALGYNNEELEVSARDPQEVMRQLPEDALLFRFYDRIVADVELDGEIIRIASARMNFSDGQYFVDIKRVYERSQTFGWWRTDLYPMMRKEMDRHKTSYVVIWKGSKIMAYRPGVDVLLYR